MGLNVRQISLCILTLANHAQVVRPMQPVMMHRGRTPGAMQLSAVRINMCTGTNATRVHLMQEMQLAMTLQAPTRNATHAHRSQVARAISGRVMDLARQSAGRVRASALEIHATITANASLFTE